MAKDFNKPVTTDLYTAILTDIRDMLDVLTRLAPDEASNIPTGAIRWNDSNNRFESYNGSTWVALMPDASSTVKGLTQISDSYTANDSRALTTAGGKVIYDTLNTKTLDAIGGQCTPGQVPNIESLNGSLTSSQVSYPAAPTGHTRAGNTYKLDGSTTITPSQFNVHISVPEGTWESFGPTGSGATNILDEMDNISADATFVLCLLEIQARPSAGLVGEVKVYGAANGVTPATGPGAQLGGVHIRDTNANDGQAEISIPVMIPLDSSQRFQLRYEELNVSSGFIYLNYQGFMID